MYNSMRLNNRSNQAHSSFGSASKTFGLDNLTNSLSLHTLCSSHTVQSHIQGQFSMANTPQMTMEKDLFRVYCRSCIGMALHTSPQWCHVNVFLTLELQIARVKGSKETTDHLSSPLKSDCPISHSTAGLSRYLVAYLKRLEGCVLFFAFPGGGRSAQIFYLIKSSDKSSNTTMQKYLSKSTKASLK